MVKLSRSWRGVSEARNSCCSFKGLSSVPGTHIRWLTAISNSSPRGWDIFRFIPTTAHMWKTHTTHLYTHTYKYKQIFKVKEIWAGEMVRWFRALATLIENRIWFLAHTCWLPTSFNCSSRDSEPLSGPLPESGMHVIHMYTVTLNIHKHKINL